MREGIKEKWGTWTTVAESSRCWQSLCAVGVSSMSRTGMELLLWLRVEKA